MVLPTGQEDRAAFRSVDGEVAQPLDPADLYADRGKGVEGQLAAIDLVWINTEENVVWPTVVNLHFCDRGLRHVIRQALHAINRIVLSDASRDEFAKRSFHHGSRRLDHIETVSALSDYAHMRIMAVGRHADSACLWAR